MVAHRYGLARHAAIVPVALVLWGFGGCAAHRAARPSDSQLLIGRQTDRSAVVALGDKAAELSAGKPLEARELCKLPGATVDLLLVRGAEEPHQHPDHDLIVVLLRGTGLMLLGGETHRVQAGDVVIIERGTNHAFRNRAREGSLALVVRVPPSTPSPMAAER